MESSANQLLQSLFDGRCVFAEFHTDIELFRFNNEIYKDLKKIAKKNSVQTQFVLRYKNGYRLKIEYYLEDEDFLQDGHYRHSLSYDDIVEVINIIGIDKFLDL